MDVSLFARGMWKFHTRQTGRPYCRPWICSTANQVIPDAVFVANDHMAFAVMDVLRFASLGLSVPDDVSVVGYDDVQLASLDKLSI